MSCKEKSGTSAVDSEHALSTFEVPPGFKIELIAVWLVLAGHEMGASGNQTTRLSMLKKLIEYAQNPANGIWIAPVGTVAKYIKGQKGLF